MRRKLRVLFAAYEAVPFMKTGGLGDVGGSLPKALKEVGCEARVILPKFGTIAEKYQKQMKHVVDFNVQLGWRNLYCGIEKLVYNNVTYYFVDNEYYFKREMPYGYFDDGERIAFFSKAIVESLQYLPDFKCDVLHCNDWHTALAPVFLREFYNGIPLYDNVKTMLTVHNLKFQGVFSDVILDDILGLANIKAAEEQLKFGYNAVNYMQGGLSYSDILSTVSPTYAEEIKSEFYGENLENIFIRRADALYGIMNGIDKDFYNPETDTAIAHNFSKDDLSGKALCKAELQRELGLVEDPTVPIIVMIGRLTEQKGLELLRHVLDELMLKPVQLVVLGTGDKEYENLMRYFADKYPGKMSAQIRFSEDLSHRMYAGADMLLMPSQFEPCGLSQMIAMRYAALPVVRETGGLKDSVKPYNKFTGEGTGFSFANFNAHEMLFTLFDAISLYRDEPEKWAGLVQNAMNEDFGWGRAAKEYARIYNSLHPEITPYVKL